MKQGRRMLSMLGLVLAILTMNSDLALGQKHLHEERTIPNGTHARLAASHRTTTSGMRDRLLLYDVKYYGLDLDISTATTAFGGNATMKASVGATPIDTLVIALINTVGGATMIADSVIVDGVPRSFVHQNNLIQIPLSPSIPGGSSFTSRVFYHGDDANAGVGLVRGSKYGMTFMYAYVWALYASYLFPCKDMLEDWADSVSIAITTEPSNKVVATGALIRSIPAGTGRIRWEFASHWSLPPTDISFVVGPYVEYKTACYLPAVADSMVIRGFLFPASPYLTKQIAVIEKSKEYLAYFTSLFGPIPFWRNEHHFVTTDWTGGAMYVLGLSLFSELRFDTTVVDRGSFQVYFVPHEISHAWFGSTVGPLTECDLALAEGFATYAEQIAMEHFRDQSVARHNVALTKNFVMSAPGGSVYIPPADRYNEARVLDDRLTYSKGAMILHLLRFELGSDSLFFPIMRDYLAEFAGRAITGGIFKDFLQRKTGRDFNAFFAQWYYGEGYPTFTIRWTRETGKVKILSTQAPSMSSVTPLFKTSLEFKLIYAGGDTTVRVSQSTLTDTFRIATSRVIDSIVVDPNGWLLCKVKSVTYYVLVSDDVQQAPLPDEFALRQNYPNPFNPATMISYQLPVTSLVRLVVYDMLGRQVSVLVNDKRDAGVHEVKFDGSEVSSGVYFYRLQAGDFVQSKRLMLVK
jgi:aminopeptidase N